MAQSRFAMKRESEYDASYNLDPNITNLSQFNSSPFAINTSHADSSGSVITMDNKYDKARQVPSSSAMKIIKIFKQTGMSSTGTRTQLPTPKLLYKQKTHPNQSSLRLETVICILFGVLFGFYLATSIRTRILNCQGLYSCCSNDLASSRNKAFSEANDRLNNGIFIHENIEPDKNLVFIGVMTAQKYLDTRAKSVYETWGHSIPGKMSFFSRSGSSSLFTLPLVSLPGVDDSYPPQKKSFMMLKFMHDNYIDKFEWFMRVDDDVYIKPEKIEPFLRSLNSSIPQFIGQAGLGNKDEFGLLSLDYDENFCMGGPGIVMSRETLRLVVPHIGYCLKNLYSTHEDVEIGRCVRKFANISCTWSYEMQHIFHHNSSGNDAFTGDLLSREVLRAISLHPVKQSKYLYRLHNFLNMRKIMDLRERKLQINREIFRLSRLNRSETSDSLLDKDYFSDENKLVSFTNRFMVPPKLNMIKLPTKRQDRYDFDFFTRSLFSPTYISPKRGLEGYWRRSLVDTVRQLMDEINSNSIKRGRLIDFKDLLYGYMRHHPLIGLDYILDILLVYRRYEGKKMTVPVRRHAYVRQTFDDLLFREDSLNQSIYLNVQPTSDGYLKEPNFNASTNAHLTSSIPTEESLVQDLSKFLAWLGYGNSNQTRSNEDQLKWTDNLDNKVDESKLVWIYDNLDKNSAKPKHLFNDPVNDYLKNSFEINKDLNAKTINFILPLRGRLEIFERFMKNYEDVCLKTNQAASLIVVLFEPAIESSPKQRDRIKELFDRLQAKYLNGKQNSLNLIVSKEAKFSRSIGCELGAASLADNELLFFIDVDIIFTYDFLTRVRLNTIEGRQVYYPIVFSEYDPDDTRDALRETNKLDPFNSRSRRLTSRERDHFEINEEKGYWRQFGFGIVAAYKSDLKKAGGFDTSIVGWGKEDVDLFEKFIKQNIYIFRTVDPGLVHVFHKIECDKSLVEEQMLMCTGSKATSIASQSVLAQLFYEKKLHLRDLNKFIPFQSQEPEKSFPLQPRAHENEPRPKISTSRG